MTNSKNADTQLAPAEQTAVCPHNRGKARIKRLAWRFGMIFCVFLAWSAYSDNTTNTPTDPVAFFKLAISKPPDVERFIVSQRSIKSESTSYYVGAIAGSNYFLQMLSSSNAFLSLSNRQLIVGRSAAAAYEVGLNNASYGIGSNGLTGSVGMLFELTRQLLHMGISEIEPESVRWTSNTFTATTSNGYTRYGELGISNGLPFRLGISDAKGLPPYKVVEYTYPDPSTSLNGFPSKMVIAVGPGGKLKPVTEVFFYSVRLAGRPLSGDFFAAAQFVGTNIIHTNIYSNADLYVGNRKGQMVKVPDSVRESGGYTNSHSRTLFFLFFLLSVIVPITFFILQRKKTNKPGKE